MRLPCRRTRTLRRMTLVVCAVWIRQLRAVPLALISPAPHSLVPRRLAPVRLVLLVLPVA